MARLAAGDRSAIPPAYEVLWPLVRRFSMRALAGSADAEDVAQQALLKVFDRVADFDPKRDALPWVLAIAACECQTARRRTWRRREHAGLEPALVLAAPDDPEGEVMGRELEAAVRDAVGELAPGDAAIVRSAMADVGGMGATMRKRLSRALARLRILWRTKHGTE
jgi:RNA polymerase sigma-70 factor (ECF subfamily)